MEAEGYMGWPTKKKTPAKLKRLKTLEKDPWLGGRGREEPGCLKSHSRSERALSRGPTRADPQGEKSALQCWERAFGPPFCPLWWNLQ